MIAVRNLLLFVCVFAAFSLLGYWLEYKEFMNTKWLFVLGWIGKDVYECIKIKKPIK